MSNFRKSQASRPTPLKILSAASIYVTRFPIVIQGRFSFTANTNIKAINQVLKYTACMSGKPARGGKQRCIFQAGRWDRKRTRARHRRHIATVFFFFLQGDLRYIIRMK